MSNVGKYTDKQLLDRVKSHAVGFTHIPAGYWLIGVQSNEDEADLFEDKLYLFKHDKFQAVYSGTTNTGMYGLLNFSKWNKKGAAVWVLNRMYYGVWERGLHKGKAKAYVQSKNTCNVEIYRDNNKNKKAEQGGTIYKGRFGLNCHTVTYVTNPIKRALKKIFRIGGWSVGCIVFNIVKQFDDFLSRTKNQRFMHFAIIEEFKPKSDGTKNI